MSESVHEEEFRIAVEKMTTVFCLSPITMEVGREGRKREVIGWKIM